MIEETYWHPVALRGDVESQPLAVTLLGHPLVLWRDASHVVHAWADQCPHRGARLSLGQVRDGKLVCAYHGWQFAGSGQCTLVPALPDFKPPAAHCAKTFQAREAYGLVWVRMATQPSLAEANLASPIGPAFAALPDFSAEESSELRKVNCGPYDVATSAPRIVENFLDMAHFGFVHDGWLGTRSATAIGDYQVEASPTGLTATECKAWQPQSNLLSRAPALVEYTYEVTAPYAAVLTKLPDPASMGSVAQTALTGQANRYHESIALFICPLEPDLSRVWFRLAVADLTSTDSQLRDFQHTIFMQDKPILESQIPKLLPLNSGAELHTPADRASSAYRRHLKKLGITFGVIQ